MNRTRSLKTHAPVVFLGVLLLGLSESQAVNWDAGGSGTNLNWSTGANWLPDGVPATGDSVIFDNTGSHATAGTTTNIVDTTRSIGPMTYSNNTATTTQTTQINGTLTTTGQVTIGSGVGGTTVVNIKGSTFNPANIDVAGGLGNTTVVLDMSGLTNFTTGLMQFGNGNGTKSTVTFGTNTTQNGGINQAFRFQSRGVNGGSLNLGQTTTLRGGEMTFGSGYGSTGNTIGFRSGLNPNPTLFIRGDTLITTRTPMVVGQIAVSGNGNFDAVMDLTAGGGTDGSIDALLSTLTLGAKFNAVTGNVAGTLNYDQGIIDATTVNLALFGVSPTAGTATGTLTLGGTGTLVAGTLNFGENAAGGTTAANGIVNLSGGTFKATTVQLGPAAGAGTRSGTLNFNSGKIQNLSGGNLTIASGLTLNSLTAGTHTFEADATRSITVNSALVGAGTGDVVKAGAGTVNFNAANTYAGNTNITAGTLALGASGTITNNSVITVGTTGSSGTVLDVTAKSSFAIGATQTLKGIGNVNIGAGKTVTINGTLAPGNSIGADSVTGNLTLAGTSSFELGTAGASHASPGTSDRTDVTGDLALGGTLTLVDNAGAGGNGSFGPGSYKIFTYGSASGSLSGSFSTINNIGTTHAKIVDGGAGTGSGQGVFLDAYRLASASAHTPEPVSFGTVLVGTALSQSLSLTNNATNDGFSEGLNASIGGATGNATTNGGSFSVLAAGSTNNSSLSAGINTATAGSKSGTATITLNSNGTGTSGFGTTSLGTQTVNLTATVLDAALASFLATPLTTTLNVGIGSFAQGSGSHTAGFSIFNLLQTAGFTADLSLVALPIVGADDANLSTDLATFNNLLAGSSNSFLATLTTANAGSFSEQYDLQLRSTGFASDTIQHLTLNISGSVVPVPEPSAFITMLLGTCGLWLVRRKR